MDSIEALLEALKRHQTDTGLDKLGDDNEDMPKMTRISVSKATPLKLGDESDHYGMDDMPMDDESEDEDENAKIVGVLQSDYPNIYAKIAKQVGADNETAEPDEPDPMDMTL